MARHGEPRQGLCKKSSHKCASRAQRNINKSSVASRDDDAGALGRAAANAHDSWRHQAGLGAARKLTMADYNDDWLGLSCTQVGHLLFACC